MLVHKNLSVVIITKNEEADIANCLKAVSQVSDDIVIVDSFSEDRTPEICQSFENVQFIQQKWLGFSEQKNVGIRLTKHDFVLSIDGDEILSGKLITSINAEMLNPKYEAYSFKIMPYFCGKPIRFAGQRIQKMRLWRKSLGMWEGTLHELIAFSEPVKIKPLQGVAEHYTIPSEANFRAKIKSYSQLFAEQKYGTKPKPSRLRLIVGPAFTFFRMYIIQGGIFDGIPGLRFCYLMALLNHSKYAALRQRYMDESAK